MSERVKIDPAITIELHLNAIEGEVKTLREAADRLTRERDEYAKAHWALGEKYRQVKRERDEARAEWALSRQRECDISEVERERDEARRALTAILTALIHYRSAIPLECLEFMKAEIDRALALQGEKSS